MQPAKVIVGKQIRTSKVEEILNSHGRIKQDIKTNEKAARALLRITKQIKFQQKHPRTQPAKRKSQKWLSTSKRQGYTTKTRHDNHGHCC